MLRTIDRRALQWHNSFMHLPSLVPSLFLSLLISVGAQAQHTSDLQRELQALKSWAQVSSSDEHQQVAVDSERAKQWQALERYAAQSRRSQELMQSAQELKTQAVAQAPIQPMEEDQINSSMSAPVRPSSDSPVAEGRPHSLRRRSFYPR